MIGWFRRERDPGSINAYAFLRVGALANEEIVLKTYETQRENKEKNGGWRRDADFAYKVLTDGDLRERHDRALREKHKLSDLYFFETLKRALDFLSLKSCAVVNVNSFPSLRNEKSSLQNVTYSKHVKDRLQQDCVHSMFSGLRSSIPNLRPDGLFAVVNSHFIFVPEVEYGKSYDQLTVVLTCAWNIYAYRSPVVNFTLNKHDK